MEFQQPHPKIKVFLADDSLIVREHLVTMLTEVTEVEIVGQAENVPDAINGIGKLQPDLVILDIRMPGGSGIDVLEKIKQEEIRPLVMILTNYPYFGYRQRCLNAGADYFLDKSKEFDQIPIVIERFAQEAKSDKEKPV